ncbi:helix-turn-helix domain-containing protein [uncultured Selenomonas sp.]|uniref:helix-turn-helix domain-containing protein n=1 Tax=uncultured Selenomonas sp. TaxID=159275 RepID=UPI00260EBCA0|nr:helix-turn-helix transcriptional regulator [uncultured Selenomonas sp.]
MNINQRIKTIRKQLGLNQTEFGEKIGLAQTGVSWIEKDGNTVIEQNIRLICETFGINEAWLRTGEGEREAVSAASDPFLPLRQKHQLSFIEEQVLRIYFKLDETAREAVCQYVQSVAEAIAESPPAEERVSDAERAEMHRLLDAELDAEEKARSASEDGNAKRA